MKLRGRHNAGWYSSRGAIVGGELHIGECGGHNPLIPATLCLLNVDRQINTRMIVFVCSSVVHVKHRSNGLDMLRVSRNTLVRTLLWPARSNYRVL